MSLVGVVGGEAAAEVLQTLVGDETVELDGGGVFLRGVLHPWEEGGGCAGSRISVLQVFVFRGHG